MGEAAAKEPTMEDILSSIRKIIAEEGEPDSGKVENKPEPTLDEPVEVVGAEKPMARPCEEPLQPNLQQIADRVASAQQLSRSVAQSNVAQEPEISPAPRVVENVAPSADPEIMQNVQEAKSFADIAASVKSAGNSSHPAMPQEAKAPPSPEPPRPAAPRQTAVGLQSEVPKEPETPTRAKPVIAEEIRQPEPVAEQQVYRSEPEPVQPQPVAASVAIPSAEESVSAPDPADLEESAFKGALMSPSSDTKVSDSFDRLKRSVMDDMEAKTEAVLRPMLREWLDENLPNMVERMVREEIERVARG